jgi:hypothetical protein
MSCVIEDQSRQTFLDSNGATAIFDFVGKRSASTLALQQCTENRRPAQDRCEG